MSLELFQLSAAGIQEILARAMARGGEFAEIYCEFSRYNNLVMEEGILKTASITTEKGMGVRVVKGNQTGYAYTEIFDRSNFMKIAEIAATIADDGGSQVAVPLQPVSLTNHYPVMFPADEVEIEKKITWIFKADHYARAYSDKVKRVVVSYTDHKKSLLLADSRGQLIQDEQPMLRFNVSVIAEDGEEKQQASAGDGGRVGMDFMTEEKVRSWSESAARVAIQLLSAVQAPSGMLPVVLGPGDSGILLHEAIGHPLEADFNRKGSSAYSNRMGEKVADAQCTIVDDGTVMNDRGSINIDDELNPSQRTLLIENGRLVSYMYDEISARHFGRESTGNGRRESYRYQPLPRMRTTYMLPGQYDPEEIIASTEKGVYCKTFKGGQVDISNGNFIFVPSEAYLIEKGKIGAPIKNFSLIGNGPEILSNVTMVGSDFRMSAGIWTCGKGQSVPVGVGLPTVKISAMTVGGQ